jgi:hypothetical protein
LAETFGSGNFGIGLGLAERDEDFAGVLRAFAEPDAALDEAATVTAFAFVPRFFFPGLAEAFAFSADAF